MQTQQNMARLAGVLFLVPLLSYGFGNALVEAVLAQPDYLSTLVYHKNRLLAGALLMLVNSGAVVALGVVLYPILRPHYPRLALGYLAARLMEAVVLAGGIVSLLTLGTLSQQLVVAPEVLYLNTLGTLAVQVHYLAYQLAMIVLGLGSIFFCLVLHKSRLAPPWLAVWGGGGYFLLLVGAGLELFGYPYGITLALPGGLFELTLGLWLIFRGFNRPVVREVPA
ncbi:hypothetical protein GCM10027275_38280 [Rhabdobacter roseus]|uniref:DUF4386 domain-containing protein n=1 Tax=Rhabdobacter roseus TaxID=1655419 RepID=A0A840TR15_9BACT|nr:DUF4386 domain-containing protein [Rhabdobacter roseus]MBB5285764.1 hypothetical protein [Rhabdobacter roseus]